MAGCLGSLRHVPVAAISALAMLGMEAIVADGARACSPINIEQLASAGHLVVEGDVVSTGSARRVWRGQAVDTFDLELVVRHVHKGDAPATVRVAALGSCGDTPAKMLPRFERSPATTGRYAILMALRDDEGYFLPGSYAWANGADRDDPRVQCVRSMVGAQLTPRDQARRSAPSTSCRVQLSSREDVGPHGVSLIAGAAGASVLLVALAVLVLVPPRLQTPEPYPGASALMSRPHHSAGRPGRHPGAR